MKRILICVLVLMCLFSAALAETSHVYDPSGIFSAKERAGLEADAQALMDEYGVDLLLAITREPIGMEAYDYAPEIYAELRGADACADYGVFAVDLAGRTYGFDAEGQLGRAMNDYGGSRVENLLLRYLSNGDYLGAMNAWIDLARTLSNPANGYGQPVTPLAFAADYIVFILIGAMVIAGIMVGIMISKLKTAKFQSAANAYVVENSMQLRTATEHFLYETVTQRKIERSNSNGGGGSHSSSSSCRGGGHF